MDNIELLKEMDYSYLKEVVFDTEYNFIIKIYNKDSVFLYKDESGYPSHGSYSYATHKELVVVTDGENYATATFEVIAFS
jgi:hypothetical protein